MKKITLSLIVPLAISTFAMAESYPAYGPDSYAAKHKQGPYAVQKDEVKYASGNDDSNIASTVDRQGFRLGLGLGLGNTNLEYDGFTIRGEDSNNFTGFATSFEVGYGVTNQLSINYINNVSWFSDQGDKYGGGFSGISMNYYIDNTVDTFYVVGGLGFGILRDFDSGNHTDAEGSFLLGGGYAMSNWEFEVDVEFTNFGESDYSRYGMDMRTIQATVSYMFF